MSKYIAQENLKDMTNLDLISLIKSSFILRKFEEFNTLYEQVHSEAVQRMDSFLPWELKALEIIYTDHNVFQDSPFVKLKMSNDAK